MIKKIILILLILLLLFTWCIDIFIMGKNIVTGEDVNVIGEDVNVKGEVGNSTGEDGNVLSELQLNGRFGAVL